MANKEKENLPLHFDISAAVVKQLGEELITDEVTALMELIKNSYDADASWVNIEINTKDKLNEPNAIYSGQKGYIIIEDNGFGMNENDIKHGWLTISLSKKRESKVKGEITKKGRTPLGDKGLGRLSTQRLAHRLELFTGMKNEKIYYHIGFNWDDFTDNTSLTNVDVSFSGIGKDLKYSGTKLILSQLKTPEIWLGKSGDFMKGQISQLLSPFKERREFNVYLKINNEKIDFDKISDNLRELAISRFSFKYNNNNIEISGKIKLSKLLGKNSEAYEKLILADNGKDFFDFLINNDRNIRNYLQGIHYLGKNGWFYAFKQFIDLIDLPKENIFDNEKKKLIFANPGNFEGEIDEFSFANDPLESAFDSFSQYKNIVQGQVGIRIYRNGFGIKPFGIDGHDWLRLSEGQTRGGSYYMLRPHNIIGFIAITAEDNTNLKEKTDREGFIDDAYSRNFINFVKEIVKRINNLLETTRRSFNEYYKEYLEQKGGINSLTDSYSRLIDTAEKAGHLEKEIDNIKDEFNEVKISIENEIESAISTKENKPAIKILKKADKLLRNVDVILEKTATIIKVSKRLKDDANYLKPKIENLEHQLVEFSELASLGLTSEALSHETSNIIDRLTLDTNQLIKQINKEKTTSSDVFTYIEYIKSFISTLRKQISHIAPSLKYVRESKDTISIYRIINELKNFYNEKNQSNIEIIVNKKSKDYDIVINKGKLIQIFDNIILNSEYWLKESGKSIDNFNPEINIIIDEPFIQISDNGYGIDPSLDTRIFQPFVTAKPKNLGRGLGLFIVQQLLDSVGCDITLLNKLNIYNRKYIFQINFDPIIK